MHLVIVFIVITVKVRGDLYQECAKLYNPHNYLSHLPSLKLPYLGDIPVPINTPPMIKPSPVLKTKAISVVTKYVYKNPVCVKYSKKKNMCKQDSSIKHKGNFEQLITKEYFVNDNKKHAVEKARRRKTFEVHDEEYHKNENSDHEAYSDEEDANLNELDYTVKGSEDLSQFSKEIRKTPDLSNKQIYEMLIEDRLDQLETILPHYTRKRIYETSTITVTKVLSNRRTMATLVVQNCVPHGYEFCAPRTRNRKSKVAQLTNDTNERHYFG